MWSVSGYVLKGEMWNVSVKEDQELLQLLNSWWMEVLFSKQGKTWGECLGGEKCQ